ncbi:MAG: hypothetical protein ACLVJK_11400 [Alistipes putredinis]
MQAVTRGAYITLSDLRAADGKLYYGSIASGRDEAHCFDLGEGREYRLSTSTYGSFAPAPADSGAVWTTTYDRKGYRITRQENIEPIPVAPSQLPVDLVNPPRRRWNVVNLDTVRYTPADSASCTANIRHAATARDCTCSGRTAGPPYRSTRSRPSKSSTPGSCGAPPFSPKICCRAPKPSHRGAGAGPTAMC